MNDLTIQADLACLECEYNLRSLPVEGKCPECGGYIYEMFETAASRVPRQTIRRLAWLARSQVWTALLSVALIVVLPLVATLIGVAWFFMVVVVVAVCLVYAIISTVELVCHADDMIGYSNRIMKIASIALIGMAYLVRIGGHGFAGDIIIIVLISCVLVTAWGSAALHRVFEVMSHEPLAKAALKSQVLSVAALFGFLIGVALPSAEDVLMCSVAAIYVAHLAIHFTILVLGSAWLHRISPFVDYASQHQLVDKICYKYGVDRSAER